MKMKEKKLNSKSILLAVLVAANVILAGLLLQSISEERSLEAQFSEQTDAAAHVQEEIKITLPETIYVASGIFRILWKRCLKEQYPVVLIRICLRRMICFTKTIHRIAVL